MEKLNGQYVQKNSKKVKMSNLDIGPIQKLTQKLQNLQKLKNWSCVENGKMRLNENKIYV